VRQVGRSVPRELDRLGLTRQKVVDRVDEWPHLDRVRPAQLRRSSTAHI
jgi:hypothetical protein